MTSKFERDKVYKTRDGREARVICVDAPTLRPVIALMRSEFGEWKTQAYFADGVAFSSCVSDIDLMLPTPEPIVEWGLVRVSDNQWVDGYGTERTARAIAADPENVPRFRLAKRTTEIVD